MQFTPENLPVVLPIIGQAMLGIFAVVGVVVLVVMGMTALARRIEEGQKDKAE